MTDLWLYGAVIGGILVVGYLYMTGKWGRDTQEAGVHEADPTMSDNSLFISPDGYGVDRILKMVSSNSPDKKRVNLHLERAKVAIDDFVEGETLFELDNKAAMVGDPIKKIVLHLPRNHWLRTQIAVKDYGPVIDNLTMENSQMKDLIKGMIEESGKDLTHWMGKVIELKRASGSGILPWMLGGGRSGSRYPYSDMGMED